MAKPTIPECSAYEVCRAKQAGCEICRELPVNEWKRHVRIVLDD